MMRRTQRDRNGALRVIKRTVANAQASQRGVVVQQVDSFPEVQRPSRCRIPDGST